LDYRPHAYQAETERWPALTSVDSAGAVTPLETILVAYRAGPKCRNRQPLPVRTSLTWEEARVFW
jgi:hypothetical protein